MEKILFDYINDKINQLLKVIGTKPINKDDISPETLLELDPLGIIAETFETILENLTEKNKQLKIINNRLEILLNTISDGIYVVDKDFNIKFINETERKLLNLSMEEILTNKCYKIFKNLTQPCKNCFVLKVINSKKAYFLKTVLLKELNFINTGEREVVDISFYPFEDDQVLVYIKDLTEIYQKIKLINFEKEKLLVILQSMMEGVIVIDNDFKVLLINNSCEEILEISYSKIKDKNLFNFFPFFKLLFDDKVSKVKEINYNNKILESTSSPIFFENNIKGYVIVLRDITEKKRFQNEIQKIEKLEAVGLLAGGIAHDFNNILTTAYGNIELCELLINDRSKLINKLKLIKNSLLKAKNLTEKLLTFSKGGEPVKDIVEIIDIIQESINFVLSGSSIAVDYFFEENLYNVEVDPGQIYQVFSNLALNSKQAMKGKGKIEVVIKNFKNNKIKIIFKDNGPGIPKKYLNKIFDPFFTTKNGNSGLGLSIVYNIIKKHNGEIFVNSEIGKGTEFVIYLPAVKRKIIKRKNNILNEKAKNHPLKVLIMDDDADLRKTIKEILELKGFIVFEASRGEEAIEVYKTRKIDIVILDLTVIGGLGGVDTLKVLKNINPQVKAIVSSGYSNDPVMSKFREYGFVDKIEKPFKIEELVNLIYKVA